MILTFDNPYKIWVHSEALCTRESTANVYTTKLGYTKTLIYLSGMWKNAAAYNDNTEQSLLK